MGSAPVATALSVCWMRSAKRSSVARETAGVYTCPAGHWHAPEVWPIPRKCTLTDPPRTSRRLTRQRFRLPLSIQQIPTLAITYDERVKSYF